MGCYILLQIVGSGVIAEVDPVTELELTAVVVAGVICYKYFGAHVVMFLKKQPPIMEAARF